MILETDVFEMWMERIMERFDRHERLLASLTGKEVKEVKYLDGERLLDNQDLCQLLQASKRSLQRYRSSGTLRYQMLWHKIYYKESDVQDFLKNHFDEFAGCRKVEKKTG
ncbi:helix-turn-helix domain-containing protein [Bacteroides fragilis]